MIAYYDEGATQTETYSKIATPTNNLDSLRRAGTKMLHFYGTE